MTSENIMTEFIQNWIESNPQRGFKVVKDEHRKTSGEVILPKRGTSKAMAYDFYANADYVVEPCKWHIDDDGHVEFEPSSVTKIWTDVKAYMLPDEGLVLNVRSSMGGRLMLANTQGWIDSDYYENESNDGNIGIFLVNMTNKLQSIKKGDRIAQGMFIKSLIADNDTYMSENRFGGFGSTGK